MGHLTRQSVATRKSLPNISCVSPEVRGSPEMSRYLLQSRDASWNQKEPSSAICCFQNLGASTAHALWASSSGQEVFPPLRQKSKNSGKRQAVELFPGAESRMNYNGCRLQRSLTSMFFHIRIAHHYPHPISPFVSFFNRKPPPTSIFFCSKIFFLIALFWKRNHFSCLPS